MSLVERVECRVGEWARGVGVEEEVECKTKVVVFDAFVFVLVGEFEGEENGVVVVRVCCFVERGKVEGLDEAFWVLSSECEP